MINLFINFFTSPEPERNEEFKICLEKNIQNPLIDKIFVIEQLEALPLSSDKIQNISFNGRPFFDDYFKFINEMVPKDQISIISNLDIFFDESLEALNHMDLREKVLALTRYDILNAQLENKFFGRSDSQDTWIFSGKIKKIFGRFPLGIRGCDNRIAYEIRKSGYQISNPSLTIRSFHYHLSFYRNFFYQTTKIDPPYLKLIPCELKYF